MNGVVIRVLPNKGFAFIRGSDGLSRFMHVNDMHRPLDFDTLREGQAVEFIPTTENSGKGNGLRATEVKLREA